MPTLPATPATTAVVKLFRFITDTPKLTTGLLLTANFCPTAVLSRFSEGRVRQQRTNRTARFHTVQSLADNSSLSASPLPAGMFTAGSESPARTCGNYTHNRYLLPVKSLACGRKYHFPPLRIQVSETNPTLETTWLIPGILTPISTCRSTTQVFGLSHVSR